MEKIIVGEILKPQGIKGELKVQALCDIEQFLHFKEIYLQGNNIPVTITNCCVRGGYVYLKLPNVIDRNTAENMRGFAISVPKSDLVVEDGSYLIEDLIGCEVWTDQGENIGRVEDVNQYGSADIIEIFGKFGKWQFPFLVDVIISVDINQKKIVVNKKKFDEVKV